MLFKRKTTTALLAATLTLFAAGCKKKVTAPPQPPPQPPPPAQPEPTRPSAPVVSQFSAEPTSIQRGQSSTLRWEITGNVTSVSIDQTIGTVQNTGNRRVFPSEPTTYTLTATGAGGSTTASATVNVTSPPPPPPPPPADTGGNKGTPGDRLSSSVQDAYFDYDKSDIRGDAQTTLQQNATALKAVLADFPTLTVVIEGHCDDRGSAEYNLGLGDRRASAAKEYLVQLGIPADRLQTISYGKERPQCTDQNEACWQKNRRVHFSAGQ
jgi:peptidoglycan-associated lipoprotein